MRLGVRVVERRVHLVQQAERRRVQLEEREHERDRGERLLAAREQLDRLVLLARGLREHLHAGVEDLLAGQVQARVAAAEERREHLLEVLVHHVERGLQHGHNRIDATERLWRCQETFQYLGQFYFPSVFY